MATTKQQVLALFEQNRGRNLSGETIAKQVGVSRNAVWKVIQELTHGGYDITRVAGRGYTFERRNDRLSPEGIAPYLHRPEQAQQIRIYPELPSTNTTAKGLAVAGDTSHGSIVITDDQTAGRGRYGRAWFAAPGKSVCLSFVLHPSKLAMATPSLMTIFAAVATAQAIEACFGIQARIKWVNDLFLGDKKICGILTEAVTDFESGQMDWVVLGIGINFCMEVEDFPEPLQSIGTALFDGNNPPRGTRNQLIGELINQVMTLEQGFDQAQVIASYKSRLMMLGERITVHTPREQYEATALDIDVEGRLIIETSDGIQQTLSFGEISVRSQ